MQKLLPFIDFLDNRKSSDFIVGPSNRIAYEFITQWPESFFNVNISFIYGAKQSGKSHLLNIWKDSNNAIEININDIYKDHNNEIDNIIYSGSKCIVIDNVKCPFDNEIVFFEFLNSIQQQNLYCLMCFESFSYKLIKLPDLHSRFMYYNELFVDNIDYEIMEKVINEIFISKGHKIQANVIQYLLSRVNNSFECINKLIHEIHRKSLEERSNITIHFIKKHKLL